MTNTGINLTREFIIKNEERKLATALISVSQLLPETGEHISLGHLPEAQRRAIVDFCGTTEFEVAQVALWPAGQRAPEPEFATDEATQLTFRRPSYLDRPTLDRARIVLSPLKSSDFGAGFSNCPPLPHSEPLTPSPGTPSEGEKELIRRISAEHATDVERLSAPIKFPDHQGTVPLTTGIWAKRLVSKCRPGVPCPIMTNGRCSACLR